MRSPRAWFQGLDGSERGAVRSSAAPGLGGRGEPCSSEQAGRLGKCACRQAQGGRGEGLEALNRHAIEAEHRTHRGGTHGGAAAGSASREGRLGDPFMVGIGGGEELLLRSKAQTAAWARHGLGGGGDVRRTEQPVAARHAHADEFGRAAWHRPTTSRPRRPSWSTVTKAPRMDQGSEEGLGVRAQPGTRGDGARRRRRHALWTAEWQKNFGLAHFDQ
jgi:hypothetical protein